MDIYQIFSGFVVGLLVGLTGVGGGSLMTPILLIFFNQPAAVAVGTDLLYASITKSAGIMSHGKLGNIDWRIVRLLATGSIPASILTTIYLNKLDVFSTNTVATIQFWLGIALLLTSLSVIFRNQLANLSRTNHWVKPELTTWLTILVGIIIGSLVTLTSVGAGALGVTALLILYPNLPVIRTVGTDVAHAVPLTLVAGFGHVSLGTVDYTLLSTLLIGSIPGIWLGSHLSAKVAERWLRLLLAIILVYIGQKLAFPTLNLFIGIGLLLLIVILKQYSAGNIKNSTFFNKKFR